MMVFERLDAVAAPLATSNVDTDQIIPARFLQKPRNLGYADFLFRDLRYEKSGAPNKTFVLNQPKYSAARILVAGRNFGCGSSRESAVYALQDAGFRAVIAPSFGDIFRSNCLKNGLLPIALTEADVETLWGALSNDSGEHLIVDLEKQRIEDRSGRAFPFAIDPFIKHCLLEGIDELDYTLSLVDKIAAFEAAHDQ